jgi:hypothetical protein
VGFRALELGPVLVAMLGAVILTSYLSRFAVRLEAHPWLRRAPGARGSEVVPELDPAT